jgi:hypothetical protein
MKQINFSIISQSPFSRGSEVTEMYPFNLVQSLLGFYFESLDLFPSIAATLNPLTYIPLFSPLLNHCFVLYLCGFEFYLKSTCK